MYTPPCCPRSFGVIAIDPFPKGFAFALFEEESALVDWGLKYTRSQHTQRDDSLREIKALLDFYQPTDVVVENTTQATSLRHHRIDPLFRELELMLAYKYPEISLHSVSRDQIRQAFGLSTKQDIARSIAALFPELSHRLPPPRKSYMSEDQRINIFDAAALALTWLVARNPGNPTVNGSLR